MELVSWLCVLKGEGMRPRRNSFYSKVLVQPGKQAGWRTSKEDQGTPPRHLMIIFKAPWLEATWLEGKEAKEYMQWGQGSHGNMGTGREDLSRNLITNCTNQDHVPNLTLGSHFIADNTIFVPSFPLWDMSKEVPPRHVKLPEARKETTKR